MISVRERIQTSDTDAESTSTPAQPAIVTDELRREYGGETAIDGVSLSVDRGTVYGFLGPNGAGKTTTIRMLTGLLPPTSGSGHVGGVSIENREALVEHIGYLPESPPIHEEFTGREQLEYHAGLRGMDSTVAETRIEKLLDRFDLTPDADSRIVTYSKGMRQKTGFVQAIMHRPDVVFLDEPTSGLDPRAARTVRETIDSLADDGTTVFLSTHLLPVVEDLAGEVGILYEGAVVARGSPAELRSRVEGETESSLEDVFLDVTTDEPYAADDG